MMYFADRISDNISKREPEGYLICVNVPIARSGTQQYLQDELGQSGERAVTVYRPEDEVFSQATIASFEGMPVTNDHPDAEEGVGIDVEDREQLIKVFRIRPGQAAFPVTDGTDRDLQRLRQILRRHVGFLSELLNLQAEPFQVSLFRGLVHRTCFTHPITRSLQHLRRRASIISAS